MLDTHPQMLSLNDQIVVIGGTKEQQEELKKIYLNTEVVGIKSTERINEIKTKFFINADKLRFEELMTNLLENAVKYSKKQGTITIDANKEENDFITISVSDTGIGMTKKQTKHIFEEFYKADKSRHDFESSGLGLTICKRIVEKHCGKIWVESPGVGKGTTVFFTMQLYKK